MSNFLSHLHSEIRRARLTRRGATHAPKDVPMGLHKEYSRMQTIALSKPAAIEIRLTDALADRTSKRSEVAGAPLGFETISALLGHGLQKHAGDHKRNYPSGGGLYPIETYVITTGIEDVGAGVFHYNPTKHALERLWDMPHELDIKSLAPKPENNLFSTIIVFTSVWNRSSAKYGDLTYSHALLEAGHMSENLILLATALNTNACPMAGFNDERLIELLDIDPEEEQPVHTITLSSNFGAEE